MTATATEVACPKCGGKMWDNREKKTNPKAPDFKCRDKACDGVIWPPKGGAKVSHPPIVEPVGVPMTNPYYRDELTGRGPQLVTPPSGKPEGINVGTYPGDDVNKTHDPKAEVRKLHVACFKHVCENYVPVAAAAGVDLSLEGVSALTFQLYKAQVEAK